MPKTGHFVLHSNVLPKITAGRYELRTEQTGLPFEVEPESTHVHVAAPRYVMPTEQILSSFPPANAEGAFGDRLPQIVLKRRTLPWERNPAGSAAVSATPWLALVVVAEGEAELSLATEVSKCVTEGTSLLDPADRDVEQGLYLGVTETVVKKIFPCKDDLPLLTHVRQVDVNDTELAGSDDDGWLAVVLANRLPVFDKAANKPVRYMACLVNVEGQLESLPKPLPPVQTFEFALAQDWSVLASVNMGGGPDMKVMGSTRAGLTLPLGANARAAARAPAAAPKGIGNTMQPVQSGTLDGAVHMAQPAAITSWQQTTKKIAAAALDPDAKQMVRDTMAIGFRLPIGVYALERVLRFPVLAHWSFTTSEGATFESLMQDLDVSLLGSVPELPPNSPGADAQPEVVHTGHIGLAHRTRRGDPQRAWYRGPCVPFPSARNGQSSTQPNQANQPLVLAHSADQLRRVIPDGREDLALAAAFEIGRLLALSQLSVVSALMRFRAEQFGAGRVRELLQDVLPYKLPKFGAARVDLGRFVAVNMIGVLAKEPDRLIGPRRPVADPGRPLRVDGNLDQVIASGLGLDLAALSKRAASLGLLAALEQTRVPLALAPGQGLPEAAVVPALRAALEGELLRTLLVAAPPGLGAGPQIGSHVDLAVGPQRLRERVARAKPDALDALIEAARDADADEEERP